MKDWINIALPKGRLGEKAYAMFAAGYPILAAEEVLRPVWRRERG